VNRHILLTALLLATGSGLLSGLLSGCAANSPKAAVQTQTTASGRQPDWVTQPPRQSGMAYGVGSMEIYGDPADALKRASELARVDLVSQLKVTVSGDFSSTTTETSGSGQTSQVQRNVSNYVRSQVPPVEMDEIVISDSWAGEKYAYALAELDRAKAAAHLSRDIQDVEQQIQDIAALQPQGTRLQQLQPLLPALKLFARRERLSERLQLVSMDRHGAPMSAELRALQNRIYDQISQLQVAVQLTDSGAEVIGGGVMEALTEQGLKIQQGGSYDLLFSVSASLSNKAKDGNQYVFADSRITISDARGRVLSSFSKQAKGVSGLAEVARYKASRAVAGLIGDELAVTLVDKIR